MNLKLFLFLNLIAISANVFSQTKINSWEDHLSYNTANTIAKQGNTIIVSNGYGLGKYMLNDNSVEKYTKINGLSDIGIKLLRKNSYNDNVVVVYENTNIDIIKANGDIVNISDIKRKSIPGKKFINEVFFESQFAYLACGFGIVVIDLDKNEIKDTYYLGTASLTYEVYEVTKNDTAFFAATKNGVFYAKLNSNLSFYQNWKSLNVGLPIGPYNSIINFNGKIMTNYSHFIKTNVGFKDTVYEYNGVKWAKYPYKTQSTNKKLYNFGKLVINDQWGVQDINLNGVFSAYITSYDNVNSTSIKDVVYDQDGTFWLADYKYGLIKSKGGYPYPNEFITFKGPKNNSVNDMEISNSKLIVAPVNLGTTFTNQYSKQRPNVYENNEWTYMPSVMPDTIRDINCVAIDPNDPNHVAFGCMDHGISEVKNGQFFNYNSSTPSLIASGLGYGINPMAVTFDSKSNLWAGLQFGKKVVNVLKNGTTEWIALDFEQITVLPPVVKILVDKHDQAWMVLARGVGLMVYKDAVGLSQPNANNTKLLTLDVGKGHLPTKEISSICEDKDGKIWIGTGKGLAVFNNPENVFTGSNWDSQQILIDSDGQVKILLENDNVTSIIVDGINQKWVGTSNSGVYCFSADGQKEVAHFSIENSPLYSNNIFDLAFDEKTGDVFIGSDIGIQSYKTKNIKGFDDFEEVHAFPNPIRPGFTGNVYVTGLIDEAVVKITDVAGNLVWETKSTGGRIEWNLANFEGKRAVSGVYLIHCASTNGEKKAICKLLIVN